MNKELDLWMNADFDNSYINRLQGMISNKINYTKYSDSDSSYKKARVPDIKDVIFNPPATIVLWADGTKTVVKCQENEGEYSKEVGLAMCICKKVYGNKGNYNNVFKKFIKEY